MVVESVTDTNSRGAATIRKGNTDWSWVADLAPKRGEELNRAIAEHAAWQVEAKRRVEANPPENASGMDMYFAYLRELGKVARPPREVEAKRRVEASKQGGACAKCGRAIEDEEKAYLGVRTFVGMWGSGARISPHFENHTVCEGCAPQRMVTREQYTTYAPPGREPYRVRVDERYTDAACETCSRPVVFQYAGARRRRGFHVFCCYRCQYTYHNRWRARQSELRRRKVCEVCGEKFTATRAHAKTCSPACKQKAYRKRQQEKASV